MLEYQDPAHLGFHIHVTCHVKRMEDCRTAPHREKIGWPYEFIAARLVRFCRIVQVEMQCVERAFRFMGVLVGSINMG